MQYPFDDEQKALADLTRDFMQREVAPVAIEIDNRPDPEDCFPKELLNKASKLGLRTLAVPEDWGGGGTDHLTRTLVLWTAAQIEVGFIKCLSQAWKISHALSNGLREDQKQFWLNRFVEDDDCYGSIMMTEPDHGTENRLHNNDPKLGIRTRAVLDGDYYVINGAKVFNSLSKFARILLVFVRTDHDAPPNKGTTCFLLRGDEEGIEYTRIHDKLGWRLYPNGETSFTDVRVHKDNILGEVNGAYQIRSALFRGSAELSACNNGIARGLFDYCHAWAKSRVQGGKPIIEHPTVQTMLSEMLMGIEVSEQFMWRTAWGVDNDPTFNPRFTRYQKIHSDQMATRTAQLALDILGGIGVMKESPSEKMIRDLMAFQHGDGTDSANHLQAATTFDQPA
ncbi:MAG TPA: acyl-CoA dehydrogenase family protein [Acidimicrobiia bacterium]|nr:acyl-CoA dehydrogenase family protein [Acidimicrobiia bacterium]